MGGRFDLLRPSALPGATPAISDPLECDEPLFEDEIATIRPYGAPSIRRAKSVTSCFTDEKQISQTTVTI